MKPVEVSAAHCDIGLTLGCLRVRVWYETQLQLMIKFTIHLVRNNLLLMMLIVKQPLIRFEPISLRGLLSR